MNIAVPAGWSVARVGESVSVPAVYGILQPGPDTPGGVPYVRPTEVEDHSIKTQSLRRTTPEIAAAYRRSALLPGDVILSIVGTIGKVAVVPPELSGANITQSSVRIRVPEEMALPRYIAYVLRSPQLVAQFNAARLGTAVPRLNIAHVRDLQLPLAPREQQAGIVAAIDSHFSRLDAATATLERVQRNLERYRASVLKAAVEGRLVPTEAELAKKEGRCYEPASVLLKRILAERRRRWEDAELAKLKAKGKTPTDDRWRARYVEPAAPDTDELPELPEGWCWATLEAIAEVKGGLAKGKHRRAGEQLQSVPYLRVANVQRGHIDLSEVKTIEATESEVSELALRNGDALFNEGGDRDKLGRGWVWRAELPVCIHQNHVFRARLLAPQVLPEFVSWHGNSNGQRYFFDEGKHTTNLASLSLSKLRGLPVPLPPSSEQQRIKLEVELLLSLASEAGAFSLASLKRTARLRQSILKWAFDGRLIGTVEPL